MNGDTIDYHLAQIHTKMKRIYLLLSLLTGCLYMQAAIYNVRDFGAKADGKAIDSPAINRAIEAAAQEGGGTVYPPLSGTRRTHHRSLSGKGQRIRHGRTQ